jgi:hypothetical protein
MVNASDIKNKLNSMIKNPNFTKERFISIIIIIMTITVVVLALVYFYYVKNLMSKECSIMENKYGTINGRIKSINPKDPKCGYTLKDYYIKSAYNCCSGGSYKQDFVNLCNLKTLLKQGVRGLDFEIYSVNNNPVVATSTNKSFYIKETYNSIPFSDVMNIIVNYAFSGGTAPNPTDPILFHLRIKSSNIEMYKKLAKIFKENRRYFLGPEYSYEYSGKNIGDVKLLDLSKKIILMVDKSNNRYLDNEDFYEYVNITTNSVFARALNFYNIKNTPDLTELQNFNKKNMTIGLPDKGPTPTNPSGIVCRETGTQLVAMRYQNDDVNLQENEKFFNDNGYAFVLKPDRLRYIPVTVPKPVPQDPAVSYQTRSVNSDYYSFKV